METFYSGFAELYGRDILKPNAMTSVLAYSQLIKRQLEAILPDTERRNYFERNVVLMSRMLRASMVDVVKVNGVTVPVSLYPDYQLDEKLRIVEDMRHLAEHVVIVLCVPPGKHPANWFLDFTKALHERRIQHTVFHGSSE